MTAPYYQDDQVTLHLGDALDVMARLPDGSVDAVVCDPPYGLEFMGKDWDRPWAVTATAGVGFDGREDNLTLPSHRDSRNANCRSCGGRQRGAKRCSCANPAWDRDPARDMREYQDWCTTWAAECLRLLKPGGHLLAFGGTRTHHRLACAIEDAGFEIRDSIAWLYGSGFPKSLDVSKAIDKAAGAERVVVATGAPVKRMIPGADQNRTGSWIKDNGREFVPAETTPSTDAAKQWQGWGTALKPAFEPIIVARKPISGTVAANVQAHGCGALNIDATRVAGDNPSIGRRKGSVDFLSIRPAREAEAEGRIESRQSPERFREERPGELLGRWPTNVVIDEHTAAGIDEQSGNVKGQVGMSKTRGKHRFIDGDTETVQKFDYGTTDSGGASRFFPTFRYEAKAPTTERPTADGIAHPTVKPLDLMRWLVRLITPPHGLVLDPFAGSGTTAEACIREHMRCIAIEREPDYLPLIVARLTKPMAVGFDFDEGQSS